SSVTTDSSGLLHFYGLDPHDTYSVQLLRNDNGTINHVSGSTYNQSYVNGTVNLNWTGIQPGDADHAYVLTAEATNAANDTTASGVVGTGYNDTFYGTLGDDVINGGGGWNTLMDGSRTWSNTGGMDVVDYSRASGMMNVNLMTGVATGMGNDTLTHIEGLIGGNYGNSFTDNAANNTFQGGAGNDVFYLTNGGNDTLVYKALNNADATGGNGHDSVYGFTVGNTLTNANADLLDLSDLLSGYKGSVSLLTDQGTVKLDAASQGLQDYLKVDVVGNDTVISVDRDGAGSQLTSSAVVTLVNVQTDLLTLLQNHQILI
ncbi:putative secreted protein (type I secretion substrate), partial [Paraburkholderia caballeronis]